VLYTVRLLATHTFEFARTPSNLLTRLAAFPNAPVPAWQRFELSLGVEPLILTVNVGWRKVSDFLDH
jgi:hypothetical protein